MWAAFGDCKLFEKEEKPLLDRFTPSKFQDHTNVGELVGEQGLLGFTEGKSS